MSASTFPKKIFLPFPWRPPLFSGNVEITSSVCGLKKLFLLQVNKKGMSSQVVGVWELELGGQRHLVEFEHGTTSGRRVVRVDGKEVLRRDWLFKLVGQESFRVGGSRCVVQVLPASGLSFEYALSVDGVPHAKHRSRTSRILRTWALQLDGTPTRIVLEKDTLDVWINGEKVETAGEFVEGGSETHFAVGGRSACIRALSTGDRRRGMQHTLLLEGSPVPHEGE
ncbi:hypothetical protein JTE90_006131 [Oedothorax gibbosus]|uniref:Fas apoptotic inhibitory molecule 1 n=1 Tax=Oedothorax gibbosus TaxID=931172 RepID=A0AAV6V4F5_9ARAC|nr:hypothetical protein JTE90_006131 [Oedothorax gibbosus]